MNKHLSYNSTTINLILRLDDYSAISDINFEKNLLGLLEKFDIPCTFGVVPFVYEDEWDPPPQVEHPLTQEKIDLIKPYVEKGLIEIALHGYHHHTQKIRLNGNIPGEFYGIPQEEQFNMIKRGKDFLKDAFSCSITTFIPPWNTYDENTLIALEMNGFRCISTGTRFGPINHQGSLAYLPALCSLASLQTTIEEVRKIQIDQVWVVALFHAYDFYESKDKRAQSSLTLAWFEDLLLWIRRQRDISIYTIAQAAHMDQTLTSQRYKMIGTMRRYQHITPSFLKKYGDLPSFYAPIKWNKDRLIKFRLVQIGYYGLLFVISLLMANYLGNMISSQSLMIITLGIAAIWAVMLLRLFFKRKIYFRFLSILILFSGGLTGFMLTNLTNR